MSYINPIILCSRNYKIEIDNVIFYTKNGIILPFSQSENYKNLKNEILSTEIKSSEEINSLKNDYNRLKNIEQNSLLKELGNNLVNTLNFTASITGSSNNNV